MTIKCVPIKYLGCATKAELNIKNNKDHKNIDFSVLENRLRNKESNVQYAPGRVKITKYIVLNSLISQIPEFDERSES